MLRTVVFLMAVTVLADRVPTALAEKVEVKGPHLCCAQCVKIAEGLVKKVEGCTEVKADAASKTVTFTAKDVKAAQAGFQALIDGGFSGTATIGKGGGISVGPKGIEGTADVVVVGEVHVCCGACQKAINKLFDGSKVSYEGSGPQKTVRIEGRSLSRAGVMEALHNAGFSGKIK